MEAERVADIVGLRRQLRERFPECHPSRRPRAARVDARSLAAGRGPWPTGIEAIDKVLPGGGFPGGRLSEVSGARSSGKTSVALGVVAQATAAGHPVAWVDLADTFYPPSAAEAGVDLGQLLILRPGTVALGLKAVDILLRGRAFPVVVLDWGLEPPRDKRSVGDLGSAIGRLNALLSMGEESLLVITNPDTARDPIRYYAALRLKVSRIPWDVSVRQQGESRAPTDEGAGERLRSPETAGASGAAPPPAEDARMGRDPPGAGGPGVGAPTVVGGRASPRGSNLPGAPSPRPALRLVTLPVSAGDQGGGPVAAAALSGGHEGPGIRLGGTSWPAGSQPLGLTRAAAPSPRSLGGQAEVEVIKNKLGSPGARGEVGFRGWQTSLLPLHPGLPAASPGERPGPHPR